MGNSFFDRYAELCKATGETPNSVAKIIGASSGSVTAWKNGTEPRYSTVVKIAEYFNVSVDYLLGKEKTPTVSGERNMSDAELKFALWGGCEDITDEDVADVRRYAAFLRERKKSKK